MVFYSEKFTFNNIHSEDMNVALVSFESEILNEYGITYTEQLESENYNNKHFYYRSFEEISPITLSLALVDKNGIALEWDFESRKNIIDWLMTNTFSPFISEDNPELIYYFKCTGVIKKFTHDMKGVLEVTMQPQDSYAYSPIINYPYTINGEREIEINCLGNCEDKNYPIIQIIQHEEEDVEITNQTTQSETLYITNIVKGECIEIDNELKQISSSLEINHLVDFNRKWFYLKRGKNKILIKGNCDIKFITQYRFII